MAAEEKRKAKREQAFIPPVEEKPKKETKKKENDSKVDVEAFKKKIKNSQKRRLLGQSASETPVKKKKGKS